MRITSPQELHALREKAKAAIDVRNGPKEIQVTVHMGTCGIAAGARGVLSALVQEMEKAALTKVTLRQAGCAGLCDREPMITVKDAQEKEYRYGKLNMERIRRIVHEHLAEGRPVAEYLITA